jgi:16S rRNA (cytosine967-C5)-methyltransferase
MRLSSLLGHAAQLLRIVWNSPRPSDQLASEYFRAKKYIGAHDRRFISQTVFASLRGYSAFAYCAAEAWKDLEAQGVVVTNFAHSHAKTHAQTQSQTPSQAASQTTPQAASHLEQALSVFDELRVVVACCLMGNAVGVGNISESLEELLGADATNIDERIVAVGANFAKQIGLRSDVGIAYANAVSEYWSMLEDEVSGILETELSETELTPESLEFLAARFAMPSWMMSAFNRDWFSAIELAASMLYAAPLSLRVNPLAIERSTLLTMLHEQGITGIAGKLSPDCILIEKRVNLTQTPLYREGLIEIQDEASQLAAYALAPKQGWRVLDACAGAGGKSLHIATLQRGKGEVIASDIEYERLKELPLRAKRAGLASITTQTIEPSASENKNDSAGENKLPTKLAHLQASCDAVLVDAPCSGSGTVRRSPMLKWRLTEGVVEKHATRQLAILSTFAAAVKPSGVLIYATCSVLPRENEDVIEQFLAAHPDFAPEPLAPVFAEHGIVIPMLSQTAHCVTLLPSVHGSDGFFLARMRRVF